MDNLTKIFGMLLFVFLVYFILHKIYKIENYTYGPPLQKVGLPGLDLNLGAPLMYIDNEKFNNDKLEEEHFDNFIYSLKKNKNIDRNLAIKYLMDRGVLTTSLNISSQENIIEEKRKFFIKREKEYFNLIWRLKNNKKFSNKEVLSFFK